MELYRAIKNDIEHFLKSNRKEAQGDYIYSLDRGGGK